MAGAIVKDRSVNPEVSFDINPTSRQIIQNMIKNGTFANLIKAGARYHQSGCMGCIGMGQAPASGTISLRTMPRNFPDRSGTKDDQVYLCSPETAAASALTGKITDPRDLENLFGMKYPHYEYPDAEIINLDMLVPPTKDTLEIKLNKGPNIKSLPEMSVLKSAYKIPVLLKMGDNVSTDEILKAGAEVLPFRSNIPEISKFSFSVIDETFYDRAMLAKEKYGGHIIVAGENYAQGSSREHAAIAPKYLGQVAVLAKDYARIAWQNLINFGILPLEFENPQNYDHIEQGALIEFKNLREDIMNRDLIRLEVKNKNNTMEIFTKHSLSDRQIILLLKGGVINDFNDKRSS
jgi:aconitate hydratase